MALIKSEAILLRSIRYSETSKIMTAFSREEGILKFIAKGARSQKSRYAGMLEPLYAVELVCYKKENRELHTLSQVSIISAPKQLMKNAERMTLALVCAEIISKVNALQQPNIPVYKLLKDTIYSFDHTAVNGRLLLLTFQLQLLNPLGLQPNLTICERCKTTQSQQWCFYMDDAVLVCNACENRVTNRLLLPEITRNALTVLLRVPIQKLVEIPIPIALHVPVYAFIKQFYDFHLLETSNLQTLRVLTQMKALSRLMK